jgi:hypothetical protein
MGGRLEAAIPMILKISLDAEGLETLRSSLKAWATTWDGIARHKPKKERPRFEAKVAQIKAVLAAVDEAAK